MKELTLSIYNEKGEREFDYTERDYKEIQKRFADIMFLKNVLKINYRMKTTSNYDSTYKVTFKDMGNNWTFEFDGVNSEKLSMI